MTPTAPAILYGCLHADCGYRTNPSTMGTPYTACPLCHGPWGPNPPPQEKTTGRFIIDGHTGKKIIVRPHLRGIYDRIVREHHNGKEPTP